MKLSGVRPSVLSVCLCYLSTAAAACMRRVCFCGLGGQEISIDCFAAGTQQHDAQQQMRAVSRYQLT